MTSPVTLDDLLQQPPFGLRQAEKEKILLPLLRELTVHHRQHCEVYRRITDFTAPTGSTANSLAALPYLPVGLFKHRQLRSVAAQNIRTAVTSSGTTGQQRSYIELDAMTAKLSSRALNHTIGSLTQNQRQPLLVIDTEAALTENNSVGARAAAILGLMPLGRDVTFALREDFSVDITKVKNFLSSHAGKEILLFGFTFLVWQYFRPACEQHKFDLSHATLLHSGGWKKLQEQAVDSATFKSTLHASTNLRRLINFYGMGELPGTVMLENDDGLLYPPGFADIIIRDPLTFLPLSTGQPGLIQIVSAIPHSYPGHSLLTEDMGVIAATDSGVNGYHGHGLRILGRAPRAELRGCSDVLAQRESA